MPEIGVVFRPQSPPERLPEVAAAAERAGVAELWLWEDCFLAGGLTSAAVALAGTGRLRVGVGLLPVPLRNVALTAMETAALARMFPGRFLPALGHGVQGWMGQVGARVESPMTLLEEYTDAVRALLRGERLDRSGRYVTLDGVALDGPPSRVPPVQVGAHGPRTLRLAGRIADGVVLDTALDTDGVRDAVATAAPAGEFRVTSYVAVPSHLTDPIGWLATTAAAYGEAGADVVVFVPPSERPDTLPLLEALTAR